MEQRDRQRSGSAGVGIMASWTGTASLDDLDPALIPEDKRRMLEATQAKQAKPPENDPPRPQAGPMPKSGMLSVPPQAMKQFRDYIKNVSTIKVQLTSEEARLFLDIVESMPTPKAMSDAKAIIRLTEQLEAML